jgi:mono/diheme cytochrome c family protein
MSKLLPLLSAAILLAFTSAPTKGLTPQNGAQTPESGTVSATASVAPNTQNPVKATAASQDKAKALFAVDCAMCHGDNGNGKSDLATSMNLTLPDFTDPKTLANMQDWELFNIIRGGKDKMPPEGVGRANDAEIWNVIIYLRSLSKQ